MMSVRKQAITLHNTAIEIRDLKNMFLNLWSVLEVLFVSQQNDSKIKEIEDNFLPILQRDYLVSIFHLLESDLRENIDKDELEKILSNVDNGSLSYKVASLVLLDKNESLRKELYQKLKNFPVIRSRISQMNEAYKIKKGLFTELERYTNRIRWHLRRLYRTRNAIIHSGDKPQHLKELCEHLHSYVDSGLLEIAILLVAEKPLCTIGNVLIDIKFKMDEIIKEIDDKNKFDEDTIKILLYNK